MYQKKNSIFYFSFSFSFHAEYIYQKNFPFSFLTKYIPSSNEEWYLLREISIFQLRIDQNLCSSVNRCKVSLLLLQQNQKRKKNISVYQFRRKHVRKYRCQRIGQHIDVSKYKPVHHELSPSIPLQSAPNQTGLLQEVYRSVQQNSETNLSLL